MLAPRLPLGNQRAPEFLLRDGCGTGLRCTKPKEASAIGVRRSDKRLACRTGRASEPLATTQGPRRQAACGCDGASRSGLRGLWMGIHWVSC